MKHEIMILRGWSQVTAKCVSQGYPEHLPRCIRKSRQCFLWSIRRCPRSVCMIRLLVTNIVGYIRFHFQFAASLLDSKNELIISSTYNKADKSSTYVISEKFWTIFVILVNYAQQIVGAFQSSPILNTLNYVTANNRSDSTVIHVIWSLGLKINFLKHISG